MTTPDASGARPRLSVVVAAWTGAESLELCISSVIAQLDPATDEVVVARNFATNAPAGRPATVRVLDLEFASALTVPQLRGEGLVAAAGTIVAFLEDHCRCVPEWRDSLISAYSHGPQNAVGGPVDLAHGGRAIDWAVYFYDYAAYAPPVGGGKARALSGANMSFTRDLLDQMLPKAKEPVNEAFLVAWMRAHDVAMALAPGAVAVHGKRHHPGRAIRLTFSLARSYAAARFPRPSAKRLAYALGSLVLPMLLGARITRSVFRAPRLAARFVASLGWLSVLLVCWSAGEISGYLTGAGRSGDQWR